MHVSVADTQTSPPPAVTAGHTRPSATAAPAGLASGWAVCGGVAPRLDVVAAVFAVFAVSGVDSMGDACHLAGKGGWLGGAGLRHPIG